MSQNNILKLEETVGGGNILKIELNILPFLAIFGVIFGSVFLGVYA
jgi:hypothetical protein